LKALFCYEPGKLEHRQVEAPAWQPGRAIVKIKRVGICGTDLHAFEGTQPYFSYPRILGHELAAELVEADADTGFSKGESVTILPYFNCGGCIACLRGKPNCCMHLAVCGVHVDGGLSEYLSVPANALIHNGGLSLDELALVEPLAIGAHGVRRASVEEDEFVLVVGAGPIGLATMAFARLAGARVIALDINEQRLAFCRNQLGVEHTIHATTTEVAGALLDATGGSMPTVVMDATGNLKAINQAFSYLAHSGRYVLVGLQKGDITFSHPEFHKREATLLSGRNATRHDFDMVIRSISEKKVNPITFITHRVGFEDVPQVFGTWLKPETGVIKAMVEFN